MLMESQNTVVGKQIAQGLLNPFILYVAKKKFILLEVTFLKIIVLPLGIRVGKISKTRKKIFFTGVFILETATGVLWS